MLHRERLAYKKDRSNWYSIRWYLQLLLHNTVRLAEPLKMADSLCGTLIIYTPKSKLDKKIMQLIILASLMQTFLL